MSYAEFLESKRLRVAPVGQEVRGAETEARSLFSEVAP